MKKLLFSVLFVCSIAASLSAQISEYSGWHDYPFEFTHLQLTLDMDPESEVVRGVAAWQMRVNSSQAREIELVALRTDVISVLINERTVDFHARVDTLVVTLHTAYDIDTRFKLEVKYKTESDFGVHRSASGAFWSSLLPGAASNLLPSVPSPEIQTPTDIRIIVPANWKAVANGKNLANILLPEGRRLYHWRSVTPVATTDIAVYAGALEVETITQNGTVLSVYNEPGSLTTQERAKLMETLKEFTAQTENMLEKPLPYGALNVIYLPDHRWETRFSVGGFAYVFENGGDYNKQIARAIAGQYMGLFHRSKSIDDNSHIIAAQSIIYHNLINSIGIDNRSLQKHDYPEWSTSIWKPLTSTFLNYGLTFTDSEYDFLLTDSQQAALDQLQNSLAEIVTHPAGAYSWNDWMSKLGVENPEPFIDISEPNLPEVESYTVIYELDEENGRYEFEIIPDNTYPDRYLSLVIRQFMDGAVTDLEILASNRGDRLHLNASGFVENMYLINDNPNLNFIEIKPAAFWLYQLRRDSDPARRMESARGFGRVQNDPDVQLILQDLIRNEPDEDVKASLVTSLSQILGDAFGTHQRFIELFNDSSRKVRFAALKAVRNYKGNEAVQQAVFRIISQSQDIDYVNLAIETYEYIVDEAEFYSVARGLIHEDQDDLDFTATIIPRIVNTSQGRTFAPNLMQYLGSEYSYSLRKLTFDTLIRIEMESTYWREILPDLLRDADPRFRYVALELVHHLNASDRDELLQERRYNEYDVRVLERVMSQRN
ncbi:MAG: hypothetical protein LAT57_09080 [Balneolales bacterium]|nr:hypothetical protein [Balneolales bacterium]